MVSNSLNYKSISIILVFCFSFFRKLTKKLDLDQQINFFLNKSEKNHKPWRYRPIRTCDSNTNYVVKIHILNYFVILADGFVESICKYVAG